MLFDCSIDIDILCSGSMEFVIPAVDTSDLFPISVSFSSTSTFSNLKVLFCPLECIVIVILPFIYLGN